MIRLTIILILSAILCPTSYAGDMTKVTLAETPTQLLGDRLRIRMPEGSKVEPRAVNIMAAEESPEEETRVVFDLGKKRLVLMAYETFTMEGKDFATEVKKMDQEAVQKGQAMKSELIIDRKGFRVFQSNPALVDKNREAVRIASAWVVNSDKTIQFISAYTNPVAASELQDVRKLYSRILKTLEPGEKQLSTKAHKRNLDIYSDRKTLAVQLPDGWVHTVQTGPDFLVHHLRKQVPFGDYAPSVGIYVGEHPSYHHRRGEAKPEKSEGSLIGKKANWFQVSSNGSIFMEAIRPVKEVNDYLMFHVWLSASSDKELRSLQKIAAAMRITDKPKTDRKQEDALDKE